MKFYTAKKKSVDVPIISLLDILAILLIYTVVQSKDGDGDGNGNGDSVKQVANVPRNESALKINLPSTSVLDTKTIVEKRAQLVIASDGRFSLNGMEMPKKLVHFYIEGLFKQDPATKFEIKADKLVTFEAGVYLLESLKKAGIPDDRVLWLIKDERKKN